FHVTGVQTCALPIYNVALSGSLNYDVNYKKNDWTWDNKFIAMYGINKLKGQKQQKTDDRLEINSVLGKKASGEWYYSYFLNFKRSEERRVGKACSTR